MAQRYINIGSSCTNIDYAGRPSDLVLQNIYILNDSNIPLRNSNPGSSGFPIGTNVTSNVVNYSDYVFKIWFDENLIFSASGQSFWRYLSSNTASVVPSQTPGTDITIRPASSTNNFDSQTTFDSSSSTYSFAVRHPATSTTQFSIVNSLNTTLENGLKTLLNLPTSSGFWIGGPNQFLKYDGTNFSLVTVLNNLAVNVDTDITQFYFIKYKDNDKICLGISTSASSTTPIRNAYVNDSLNIVITSGPDASSYSYTITKPSSSITLGGVFPTSATLFRLSSDGRYLYWNGSSFVLRDYWTGGLSGADIQRGMQFWLQDLTNNSDNSDSDFSNLKDFYRWMIVNSISTAPNASGNTSNLIINNSNQLLLATPSTYEPSNNEGWILSGVNNNCRLVYVKSINAVLTPVGYLQAPGGDTVNFVMINDNTLPSSSAQNNWQCIKCTPPANQSYCSFTSSGASVSTSKVGIITATYNSSTSIGVTISDSTLEIGNTIVVTVTDDRGNIVSLNSPPNNWTGTTYTLQTTSTMTTGTYVVIITSTGAVASTGGTFSAP